jgi:hypothetical protein
MRLALMPAEQGWRQAAVPQQACRFRAPLWLRPWCNPGASSGELPQFPSQEADVQVLGLKPLAAGSTEVMLTVQNLGPARRQLRLGDRWEVVHQLDGLCGTLSKEQLELAPWALSFWWLRLSPRGRQTGR